MEMTGTCHCGAVRWRLRGEVKDVTACNCSHCRRSGAIWAYAPPAEVEILAESGAIREYIHGARWLAFVSCATCNCLTHWRAIDGDQIGVNTRMADDPAVLRGMPVKYLDGADSWTYVDGPF